MKVIHLLIVFVLGSSLSQAQTFAIHNYGVAEGLPSTEVYDIFQDSKGFIWFSTDNGVVKYDGFHFKSFNVADGLPDPVVFETLEDDSGKIWFRTFSGKIAYVENEKIHPYKFNDQLVKICADSYLFSMALDHQGQLWFTTGTAHWGNISKTGKVELHEIPMGSVFYKSVDERNIIGQLRNYPRLGVTNILINDTSHPIQLSDDVLDAKKSHPVCRSLSWKGNLYICVNNNIFRYDGTEVTRVFRGHAAIINLSKDQQGNLWVGFYNGGVIRFNNTDFKNPWALTAIGLNSVTKVHQDNEGGVWISTLENGVYNIPNLDIQNFSLNSGSKVDAVVSAGQQIITGEYDGTLTRIDTQSKNILGKEKFDRSILAILNTKTKLWVGAEVVYFLDENKRTKSLIYGTVRDFTEDKNGNVWAIEGGKISKYDENGKLILNRYERVAYRNIAAFDSVLLVGLHTGLNIYDHNLNVIKTPKQLASFKISKVVQLADSLYAIATIGNGFLVTKNFDQFKHYPAPVSNIYDVAKSGSDVWFATEKGILKSTISSLLTTQPSYDFITKRSGLLNMQVSHLALAGDELFAFYNNSYSVISTAKNNYVNQSPIFYLKSLKVNNRLHENMAQLSLPYDQNDLEIGFGFISFNNQEIYTRYRLSNSHEWNDLSERTIDLNSLSPGKYPIELQYSIDKIHWTKAPQLPFIYISQPWWQTIKFQVAFAIGIAALVYLFFNNRLVIYRQRTEKMRLLSIQQQLLIQTEIETLERERNRIAKDLHDSVGTNILATKLNVSRVLKKYEDSEREAIEEQFQETMVEIKEIIYDLSPPGLERYGLATGLRNYVDRLATSTVVSFSVNTFGKELIKTTLSVPLFRILQELISNSLKHSKSNSISIHLNSFDDLYNVVYEDRGIGFSMEGNHKGLGLHSIESRVKSINGKMSFESGPFGVSYSIDVPIEKNFLRN
ncbi:MAG TPA: two-component regulator propeller domain-containing protein [Cyclobacteriaceae bacterium]|nr:two-component regulator propeller domain-containing protein [Cyclobacteriaceae bacterium]